MSIAPAVPYRRHRRFLVAVLAVVLLIGPARAQIYRLVGAGNVSCGSWTADRQTPLNFGEINWVLGFLSGVAYLGKSSQGYDPLRGLDAQDVAGWLDSYCGAHPPEYLADAAIAFIREHPR